MLIKTPTPYHDKYDYRIFFGDKVKYNENIYTIVEVDGLTMLENNDTRLWFRYFKNDEIEIVEV